MTSPKLRQWARLIQSGQHDDYDNPPAIPLITGSPAPAKAKKESVTDALTGAATAFVTLLQSKDSHSSAETPLLRKVGMHNYISPMKSTQIRRSCLEDLKKMKELLKDGVLTEEEFAAEKQGILATVKSL